MYFYVFKKAPPSGGFGYLFQDMCLLHKFNKNHDDIGRFCEEERAASRSGGRDMTSTKLRGVRGTPRRAIVNPKVSSEGKEARRIHESALARARANDRKGVTRTTSDATAVRKVGSVTSSQAVKLDRKISDGRNAANRNDYQSKNGPLVEETAHQLLTAFQSGKTARVFQSKALEKNAAQPHREISQTIDGKLFKNRAEVTKLLKEVGLEDSSVVQLDNGGFQITHSMRNSKSGSALGRVQQGKVLQLRRLLTEKGGPNSVKTTHHAGEEVVYSPRVQRKLLATFAKNNPDSHVAKAYQEHLKTRKSKRIK